MTLPINHFDSHLPNEETHHQQQIVTPENNSLFPLEQRILNNDNRQQQHIQEPDPLKSRYDSDNMLDDINDDYDSNVALRSDVSLYRAFTFLANIIRDKESKEACKNRLCEYFIE